MTISLYTKAVISQMKKATSDVAFFLQASNFNYLPIISSFCQSDSDPLTSSYPLD